MTFTYSIMGISFTKHSLFFHSVRILYYKHNFSTCAWDAVFQVVVLRKTAASSECNLQVAEKKEVGVGWGGPK